MKLILVLLIGFSVSVNYVMAGGSATTKIKSLHAGPTYNSEKIFIEVEDAVSNKPGCSTDPRWDFVLKSDSPGGKSTLSLLTLAYARNQTLLIVGSGNCVNWADIEDLDYITFE